MPLTRRAFLTALAAFSVAAKVRAALSPVPRVYLTYDDGQRDVLPLLAAALAHEIPVSWFPTGTSLRAHPAQWARVQEAGHLIGCHTNTHPFASHLSLDAFRRELDAWMLHARAVLGLEGATRTRWFRYPYGDGGTPLLESVFATEVTARGWRTAGWDVCLTEYASLNARKAYSTADMAAHLNRHLKGGDVVTLAHCLQPDASALPVLAATAARAGYTCASLSDYPENADVGACGRSLRQRCKR